MAIDSHLQIDRNPGEHRERYRLNDALEYSIDADAELTADDVYSRKKTFKPFADVSQIPRSGVMWLFFTLDNASSTAGWVVKKELDPHLDRRG